MKTNKMMRLASGLLVAVLLTTCVISGTYAKYVTSDSGSDSARVAKFGVVVTATGDAFETQYEKDDTSFTLDTNTVVSTEKVVAPGTKGEMASITLSGTPEVAVRVSYSGNFTISDNWLVNDQFYCPLVIKVGATEIKGTTYTTKDEFVIAVNNAINNVDVKDYKAGTNLSNVTDAGLNVSWEWPFEAETNVDDYDYKDTWLGGQAASNNAATVTLGITTTVTQID